MSQEKRNETWSSPNEFVITELERAYVEKLRITDEYIGKNAESKSGSGSLVQPSLPGRIARRTFFEVKKILGPSAGKIQRSILRIWHRRVTDSRRVRDGAVFISNGFTFEVMPLSQIEGRLKSKSIQADFIILTRESNALIKGAIKFIGAAVTDPTSRMWFGDSRDVNGVPTRRQAFTRLLLRQVDALGPVLVVRSEVFANPDFANLDSDILPLKLGLSLSEAEISLIPSVLGIGEPTISDLGNNRTAAIEVVEAELVHAGISAKVESSGQGRRNVCYTLRNQPLVSIIIPTRGSGNEGRAFVVEAVKSILEKSTYLNFEIVIVADDPTPQAVVSEIDELARTRVRWVRWVKDFNFSSKINIGAAVANGEYLLLLNDDVEVVSGDWITRMLSLIGIDGIAYVGALLFFDDQSIQHAGHWYKGGASHIGLAQNFQPFAPHDQLSLDRIVSGVTAACSLVSKTKYFELGGLSEQFPNNYNDVDFSMKVRVLGGRSAISADSRLYHHESKTRDATVQKVEIRRLNDRWASEIQSDPNWRNR